MDCFKRFLGEDGNSSADVLDCVYSCWFQEHGYCLLLSSNIVIVVISAIKIKQFVVELNHRFLLCDFYNWLICEAAILVCR